MKGVFTIGVGTMLTVISMVAATVFIVEQQIAGVQSAESSTTQKVDDVDARLTRIENKIDALSEHVGMGLSRLSTTTSDR